MDKTRLKRKERTFLEQQSQSRHIENSVLVMGKEDLKVGNSFKTYREMKMDGIVSGSMSFIKAILVKDFSLKGSNLNTREKLLLKALEESLEDLPTGKVGLVSNLLQALDYGCSLSEVVMKRDESGGWIVFDSLPPIHLGDVSKFQFNNGRFLGVKLSPAPNDGYVETLDRKEGGSFIEARELLFVRIEPDVDFPLGKSLLYGAYTPWKTKKILQEYEAIGVAKNLSGVLDVSAPSDYINKYFSDPQSDEAVYIENLLAQAEMLHAGKGSYILRASDTNQNGVQLFNINTIGGSGGQQSYDVGKAIQRYNEEIQFSLQTMVLSLGAKGGGSFALSDNSTHLMTLFIEYIRDAIASEFNRLLKQVWSMNGFNPNKAPKFVWDDLEPVDWDDFTKGWQRLLQAGGVTPTKDLEAFFRGMGGAPEANYKEKLDTVVKADPIERLDTTKMG